MAAPLGASRDSGVRFRGPRSGLAQQALLAAGIAAGALYVAADVLCGLLYDGYSFKDQTISELGATGAPTKGLLTALLALDSLFLAAFGVGVLRAAQDKRVLRWAGALIVVVSAIALVVAPFGPMSARGADSGFNGTLHKVYISTNSVLIMVAAGLSAFAFGWRFRLYAVGTITVMLGFGAWAATFASDIEADLATPWVGMIERIDVYAYLAWLAVLAVALIRSCPHAAQIAGSEVGTST